MARGHNLAEKTTATQVNDDFYYVVTQKETVDGSEQDAVRRMSSEIYETSAVPADIRLAIATMLVANRQQQWDYNNTKSIAEALNALNIGSRLNQLEGHLIVEVGSVTLTNSMAFPFNNSQQTVALRTTQNNSYIVRTEVASAIGNVGEIEVADTLSNGFKLFYTGSTKSATINYYVIGGFTNVSN